MLLISGYFGKFDIEALIPEGSDDFELLSSTTRTLVDTKATRGSSRSRAVSEDVAAVKKLWRRPVNDDGRSLEFWLTLERPNDTYGENFTRKSVLNTRLSNELSSHTNAQLSHVLVTTAPEETARQILEDELKLAPLSAYLIVLSLARHVGKLADSNGPLSLEARQAADKGDVRRIIDQISLAFENEKVEALVRSGSLSAINFDVAVDDEAFFSGVDVLPGHFASGQALHRPVSVAEATANLERARSCVIQGPSGSGKSALMWDAARSTRHNRTWFELKTNEQLDKDALNSFLNAYADFGPLGFIVDDIGRGKTEPFAQLADLARRHSNIWILGSIRSEDVITIEDTKSVAFLDNKPEAGVAEAIWSNLAAKGQTDWAGWREPWQQAQGLLLEYAHILTVGERLEKTISEQIKMRLLDEERHVELEVLAQTVMAASMGGAVSRDVIVERLSVSSGQLALALSRLSEEHLVRLNSKGDLITGLHALRTKAISDALDNLFFASREVQTKNAISCAAISGLEQVVSGILKKAFIDRDELVKSFSDRALDECSRVQAWIAICKGIKRFSLDKISSEWFQSAASQGLARKFATSAALFGSVDGTGFDLTPETKLIYRTGRELHDHAKSLSLPDIATQNLIEELYEALKRGEITNVIEGLSLLVGVCLSPKQIQTLVDWDVEFDALHIEQTIELCDAAESISNKIPASWIYRDETDALQHKLLAALETQTPFALKISVYDDSEGVTVQGNFDETVSAIQNRSVNDILFEHCRAMFTLVPQARFAKSELVSFDGVAVPTLDGKKRVPRPNAPANAVISYNREIVSSVAQIVCMDSWSEYLKTAALLLESGFQLFQQMLSQISIGRVPEQLLGDLNNLIGRLDSLVAPSSPAEGHEQSGNHLTPVQNLIFSLNAELVVRFAKLPEQAPALAAYLSELRSRLDEVAKEPWELLQSPPSKLLQRISEFLLQLEVISLEAAASGLTPNKRWLQSGSKPRYAIKLMAEGSSKAFSNRISRRLFALNSEINSKYTGGRVIGPKIKDGVLWGSKYIVLLPLSNVGDLENWFLDTSSFTTALEGIFNDREECHFVPVVNGKALAGFTWRSRRRDFFDRQGLGSISNFQLLAPLEPELVARIDLEAAETPSIVISSLEMIKIATATLNFLRDDGSLLKAEEEVFEHAMSTLEENRHQLSFWANETDNNTVSTLAGIVASSIDGQAGPVEISDEITPADILRGSAAIVWKQTLGVTAPLSPHNETSI